MDPIKTDLLARGLRLVICGSADDDRFWKTLAEVGLTPRELTPAESPALLELGIGLTELAKDDGSKILRRKIRDFEPRYLAFNGKRVAQDYFGLAKIEYGLHSRMGATGVFIVPSTSAAAKGAWDIAYWRQLAKLVEG